MRNINRFHLTGLVLFENKTGSRILIPSEQNQQGWLCVNEDSPKGTQTFILQIPADMHSRIVIVFEITFALKKPQNCTQKPGDISWIRSLEHVCHGENKIIMLCWWKWSKKSPSLAVTRRLYAPRLLTIDFSFIVFIFHFNAIPNEIAVLQGCLIEKLQFPVICGSPPRSPGAALGPTTRRYCSLWHLTSHAKGRVLLAVGSAHHSLMTRPLWCALDGMSVTHGGKSISLVWWESPGRIWDIHPQVRKHWEQIIISIYGMKPGSDA